MIRTKARSLLAVGALLGMAGLALAQSALPTPTGLPQGQPLGAIDLGKGFPQMQGYVLNMRFVTLAPGAGRGLHSHKAFPEILHVVSGVLTEQLADGQTKSFPAGTTLISEDGSSHMIINLGKEPTTLYSAGIIKPSPTIAKP